jgi:membrane associated rhomboid family serine protease
VQCSASADSFVNVAMSLLNSIERRLSHFAIPGIIRYVVGLNALTFILITISPGYADALALVPSRILSGEVWRLFTWIFIPPIENPIWLVFALMLLWLYGDNLEADWGTFRLNLFYLVGMIGCTASAFFVGADLAFNTLLNLSIFFAFATLNPNYQLLLFFILPIKIKWLAFVSLALLVAQALGGTWSLRVALIVTFSNYLIFFAPSFFRRTVEGRQVATRRRAFEEASIPDTTLYRCATCGRTEVSNPELDFRVALDGREYCHEHLPTRTKESSKD